MRLIGDVHELSCDPDMVSVLTDAAFEHRAHAELTADVCKLHAFPFEIERRRAARNAQPVDPRERVQDLLGNAIRKVLLVVPWAHVRERQHRDGWAWDRWRARGFYGCTPEKVQRDPWSRGEQPEREER